MKYEIIYIIMLPESVPFLINFMHGFINISTLVCKKYIPGV
jgi:hypothetical protein